jgi:hypothetical protein
MILAGEIVIIGPYNSTLAAEKDNDENLLVIREPRLAGCIPRTGGAGKFHRQGHPYSSGLTAKRRPTPVLIRSWGVRAADRLPPYIQLCTAHKTSDGLRFLPAPAVIRMAGQLVPAKSQP